MNVFRRGYIDIIAAVITKALPDGYECRYELMNCDRTVGFAIGTKLNPINDSVAWGFSVQFGIVGRTEENLEGYQGPEFTKESLLSFVDEMLEKIKKREAKQ